MQAMMYPFQFSYSLIPVYDLIITHSRRIARCFLIYLNIFLFHKNCQVMFYKVTFLNNLSAVLSCALTEYINIFLHFFELPTYTQTVLALTTPNYPHLPLCFVA